MYSFSLRTLKFARKFSQNAAAVNVKTAEGELRVTPENQFEVLNDTVIPLWRKDYLDQLVYKKEWTREILEKIKSRTNRHFQTKLHQIIPSPHTEEYRNKDEFNVRPGVDGNPKTVGFYVGRLDKGNVVCVPPTEIKIVKKKHKLIAQAYQDFIRKSPLDACYDFRKGGFWRGIVVRSNSHSMDTMVTVAVHPDGCPENEIEPVKIDLKNYFQTLDIPVTSLYFQKCPHTRCTQDTAPYELLFGEPYIYEIMGDYSFRISPGSFFQVNIDAAKLMFDSVIRFSSLSNSSTLLDLCCGTGTVSLMASKFARGCIGIESVSEAVNDAVFNARDNNVKNCHFICGTVEKKLDAAVQHLENCGKLAVVLNPGRAGVHSGVIKSILHNCMIDRIVYIACKADSPNTMKNFASLCAKRAKSDLAPFTLTHVQPVDMFPHTNHCELIMLFQR